MYTIQYSYIISKKGNPLLARCFRERANKIYRNKRTNAKEI